MTRHIINPETLAHPHGFSHGVFVNGGNLLFIAGQTGTDADGHIVAPDNLVAQYDQVLRNIQTVVETAGGVMDEIVKITIYVRDRDDYLMHLKELGQVHKDYFGNYYPATALFEISRFYQDEALIEIESIAVIDPTPVS